MKSLKRKFKWFNIEVIGVTPRISVSRRDDEILSWLSTEEDLGNQIQRFVVIDDEDFDLQVFKNRELVKTSLGTPHYGMFTSCGLKLKHVIQAIKILNRKDDAICQ